MVAESQPEDDRSISLTSLARRAGLSAQTLRNWAARPDPLVTTTQPDGRRVSNWRNLVAFCQVHPELRGSATVLQSGEPSALVAKDIEAALALARNLRAAAEERLEALIVAARATEDLARAHREQLEHLRAADRHYDDALSAMTATTVPNS